MSLGVSIFVLLIIRIVWRHISPPPQFSDNIAVIFRRLATAGHIALYGMMFLLPVVGVIMSWANGKTVAVFGLFAIPAMIGPDESLGTAMASVHALMGNAILVVAGGHAAAALFHQYVLRDGTLGRMMNEKLCDAVFRQKPK
jgi:cytochrome b561